MDDPIGRALADLQSLAGQLGQQLQGHLAKAFSHPQQRGQSIKEPRSLATPRVVRFGRPFASITDALTQRVGAGGVKVPTGKGSQKKAGSQAADAASKGKDGQEQEERILISEVEVTGVDGDLKRIAQEVLTTKPNFAYTLQEVEADVRRVFSTGYFSRCTPEAEDTRDGVKLTLKVTPNPELRGVVAHGANVLPTRVVQDAFRSMHGQTMNFVQFGKAVEKLDDWYKSRGILGQVVDFTFESGVVELSLGEAVVNSLNLQFIDQKTGEPKEQGATKPDIVLRHFTTKPGSVYSLRQAKQDIDSVYATGLFEDVNIVPKEAEESTELDPKVDLTISLVERKTGGLGFGTGFSPQAHGEGAVPAIVGNLTYSERNLFGLNQKLSALVEVGQSDKLFRLQHTDPWIRGDPYRTSRTVSVMNTRTSSNAIHGRVEGEAGDEDAGASSSGGSSGNVVLGRLISGVEYRRPVKSNWTGTAGLTWQRSKVMDEYSKPLLNDCYGAPLTFSGGDTDTMLVGLISAAYNDASDGSHLAASMEQALPVRGEWLNFNRMRLRLDQPVQMGPLTLCFRGRAGAVLGDLPPYEAFPIGGTNSVRGYAEGGVGSGRYLLEGSSELRWTIMKPVHGTLFMDYGTDLDSGESVIGDPAGTRGKPGSGFGFGGGICVDSPLGPVRLEYAWNDQRQRRFHVALGYD